MFSRCETSVNGPSPGAAAPLPQTNDVQGPFFFNGMYHMGFAWHVGGTHGIGSAPNRWWHQVSRDLAHWQIVSTTPERAMLSPSMLLGAARHVITTLSCTASLLHVASPSCLANISTTSIYS